jgi:hypothetical protein
MLRLSIGLASSNREEAIDTPGRAAATLVTSVTAA